MNLPQIIVKHIEQSLSKFQLNKGRQTFKKKRKKRVCKQPQRYVWAAMYGYNQKYIKIHQIS